MNSHAPVDDPGQVLGLYRAYLGLSRLRTDPVIVNPQSLIPQLQERTLGDIGIVRCPVRLDSDETYHHGEAEFRVSASQVAGPVLRVA